MQEKGYSQRGWLICIDNDPVQMTIIKEMNCYPLYTLSKPATIRAKQAILCAMYNSTNIINFSFY